MAENGEDATLFVKFVEHQMSHPGFKKRLQGA